LATLVPDPADAGRHCPALAFGIAIGRIGCFLNGCCYGDPCNLPWAVRFPKESPPWVAEVKRNQIPPDADFSLWLHPTQIYSTIDGLILFLLLAAYYPSESETAR